MEEHKTLTVHLCMVILLWLGILLTPALSAERYWLSSDLYKILSQEGGWEAGSDTGSLPEDEVRWANDMIYSSEIADLQSLESSVIANDDYRGYIILSSRALNPVIPLDVFDDPKRDSEYELRITCYTSDTSFDHVTLKTTRTSFRDRIPENGDGWGDAQEYLSLWLKSGLKYSVQNEKAEQNLHKLFLRTLKFEDGTSLVPQEGQSIELYIQEIALDAPFVAGTKSPQISFTGRSYVLSMTEPGEYDFTQLHWYQSISTYYRGGKLDQKYVYSYSTLSVRDYRKVVIGNNKITVAVSQSDEPNIVYKVQSKDFTVSISGISVDISCETDVNPEEMLWGTIGATQISISGQWPIIDDIVEQQRNGATSFEQVDGVQIFTYGRTTDFKIDSGENVTINSESIPFRMYVWGQFLILNLPAVHIQGMSMPCYKYELAYEKTVLRIGAVDYYSCDNREMTVYGGDLEIMFDDCSQIIEGYSFTCGTMDLRQFSRPEELPNGYKLAPNGKIMTGYGSYSFDTLSNVWSTYEKSQGEHKWTDFGQESLGPGLWSDWKYILDFPRLHAASIVQGVKEDWRVSFLPLKDIKYSGNPTLELWRKEPPFASFYSKNVSTIVCLKKGEKLNLEDWTIKWIPSIFYIVEEDITPYFPPLTEWSMSGSFQKVTQDGCECIAYQVGNPPNSAFNLIVYASNQSLIEAFSGFSEIFSFVSPATIDKPVPMHNPQGKNVLLICFDDVPNEKSIDLWNMRMDANLIVLGLPCGPVYDGRVFKALEDCMKLPDSDDFGAKVYEIIEDLVNDYRGWLPRVSLKIHRLNSIYMFMANYVGTSIDCDLFASALCHFGQIQETEVKATYVVADTLTYDSLRSKSLKNLVLVPVSLSPPDYLSVQSIEFDVGKWRLVSSGYTNWAKVQENVKYEIDTSKVEQLFVVSHTDSLTFAIPSGSSVTSVKGVSVIMDIGLDNMYSSLPVSPLLSLDDSQLQAQSMVRKAASLLSGVKLQATKANGKSATFKGAWDKVQEIQGSFAVDSGATPIQVKDVPKNVVASLQVKSSQESTVNLPAGVTIPVLEIPVQVVTGKQTLSYGNGVESVKFNNVTFNGGRTGSPLASSLSVSLGGNATPTRLDVANIKCCDYSDVTLDDLSLSNSLEMGIGAKFATTKATYGDVSLSMHFTVKSVFEDQDGKPQFAITKTPKKLTLIYDNDENAFDMNPYKEKPATLYSFSTKDACQKALDVTTFEAENPNFQGAGNVMRAQCNNNDLQLTLLRVPEPTPAPTLPPKPEDPSKVNVGAIVGGVIGALAAIAIGAVVVVLVLRRRKQQMMRRSSSSFSNETASTTEE